MKVHVQPGSSFKRTVANLQYTERIVGARIKALTRDAAALAASKAKEQLRDLVYTRDPATLQTVYKYGTDPDVYLATRRTGAVWRAIKIELAEESGDTVSYRAFVDEKDFEGYYYALILNFGGRRINYAARPFWSRMERTMTFTYAAMGRVAMRDLKRQLSGGRIQGRGTFAVTEGSQGTGDLSTTVVGTGTR